MIKNLLALLCLFVLAHALPVEAQVYPVQANVSIQPPYSPYLTDYIVPGSQKLLLQLRTNDITISDHPIKLRITIEGLGITIRTKQNFIPQQQTLYGEGTPTILYGEDLQEYFHPNNLDFAGLSKAEFLKTGKLPEGVYKFSVEVFSYNRNVQLSNKAFTMAWIILNDPPLLNLPRKDAKVKILDPTNIAFTWTPRHTASPNSAFSSEYIFRLVEIWPENRNPYDAFLSQPALYEETTTQSQIVYGLEHPALIPGRKYAWQVQAVDVEGKDLFKNQGRSEVYVFQFGDALSAPENIQQDGANATTINLSWDAPIQGAMPKLYRIRYRKKGTTDNSKWDEAITDQRWITLTSLQADTDYEIQLRSEAKPQQSEYSQLKYVSTEAETTLPYTCGKETPIFSSENSNPLLMLSAGDAISASNFKVIVTEAEGKNGTFSGKGVMSVPFFNMANVKVAFSGIQVNDQYQLVVGEIITTYNPGSPLARQVEEAHKIGEEKPEEPINTSDTTSVTTAVNLDVSGVIDSIYFDADKGEIVVVDEEGNTNTYKQPIGETSKEPMPVVVTDSAGNSYAVDKDNTSGETKITKVESGGLSQSGAGTTTQSDPVVDRVVILILEKFEEEISAWLRVNGKGGEDDPDVLLAADLPACFPQNENILSHIHDVTIPHFKERPADFRGIMETDKDLFDRLRKQFAVPNDVDLIRISETDMEALNNTTCEAVVKADLAMMETELSKIGVSKTRPCWIQGFSRGKELYGEYGFEVAAYAGFIRYLVCETEMQNCGQDSGLAAYGCGITNGLLQELDWVVLLEMEGFTKRDIANLILCVKRSFPIGGDVEDNPDLYKILFKCITGVEINDMAIAVKDFVVENWNESYYQGQATAFIITLITPFKGKIIEKLGKLSKYAKSIPKLEKLAKANSADELVDIAKKLSRSGADLSSELVNGIRKYFLNGSEVGSASISNAGYVSFDIRIPSELQKQGYATEIIEDAINFYSGENKTVNGIQGRWLSNSSYEGGMSSNLKSFKDDYLHNGKSFDEAALNTPTGKIASKNGFTKVVKGDWDILDLGGGKPADIYWMELKFKKPE